MNDAKAKAAGVSRHRRRTELDHDGRVTAAQKIDALRAENAELNADRFIRVLAEAENIAQARRARPARDGVLCSKPLRARSAVGV
jgi:hypothetical protein